MSCINDYHDSDLIDDTENIMDFLAYTKDRIITRLIPIEKIVAELRKATAQLTKGYFPFKIQLENWCTIQKYIKINAYYDRVFTVFVNFR